MNSPYLSYTIDGEPFRLFSQSHLLVLGAFIGLTLLLYFYRARIRNYALNRFFRYGLAGILVLTEITFQFWHLATESWYAMYMLPLQLCSVSLLLSVVMLLNKSYRLYEITFFWGLGGAGQAMITPELFYPFPHFRFFHFFLAHIGIILACLYMTWVEQYQPTHKSVWKAMGFLNLLLPIAFLTNRLTDGNYLFVSHKPSNPSLLDYLGPFPWYILALELVAILLFYLLYASFAWRNKSVRSVLDESM